MKSMSISQLEVQSQKVIEELSQSGEVLTITKDGKAIVEVIPMTLVPTETSESAFGALAEQSIELEDI